MHPLREGPQLALEEHGPQLREQRRELGLLLPPHDLCPARPLLQEYCRVSRLAAAAATERILG